MSRLLKIKISFDKELLINYLKENINNLEDLEDETPDQYSTFIQDLVHELLEYDSSKYIVIKPIIKEGY